ncbi:MAG: hypothetical protein KC897_03075 [Candidatus Omnitrophica bacterium]|nr:hypothetical protein [Candidatus Omnitrophota bacterium]MCB9722321.1 hypothetical protein [Candidatus Omnitrophota bacterium]
MSRKRGSVLVVTMGFVVAFTLLGMAALHFAIVQNEATERQKASMEAFWLADGAVEVAKGEYPEPIPEGTQYYLANAANEPNLNRWYRVHSKRKPVSPDYNREHRFLVYAHGSVNGQSRYIKAELDKISIADYPLITSRSPIDSPVPPKIVETIDTFAEEACGDPIVSDKLAHEEFIRFTCFRAINTENVLIEPPRQNEVGNILVIDVRELNRANIVPSITFASNIDGLISITGNVKLSERNLQGANFVLNGTLIVDGTVEFLDDNNDSVIDSDIVFDPQKVDEALYYVYRDRSIRNRSVRIVNWEEVADLGEQI